MLGDRAALEGADRAIADLHPGCGPLGGMETALRDLGLSLALHAQGKGDVLADIENNASQTAFGELAFETLEHAQQGLGVERRLVDDQWRHDGEGRE